MPKNFSRRVSRRTPKVFTSSYRPAAQPRQMNWQQYRSLTPLLWVVAAVVAIYLLGRLPIFSVQQVIVDGTQDPALINQLQNLKGHSIFSSLISNSVTHIVDQNPSIATLHCNRGIPNTLRCQVSVRSAALIWRHNNQSFLVDQNGFAFATNVNQTNLPTIDDQGHGSVNVGTVVASTEFVSDYQKLTQGLGTQGFNVSNLTVSDTFYQFSAAVTGSHSPNLPFPAHSPVTILFNFSYPINDQVRAAAEIFKEKSGSITDHVDLRVPGMAYIK